jgi:hypothetical protein
LSQKPKTNPNEANRYLIVFSQLSLKNWLRLRYTGLPAGVPAGPAIDIQLSKSSETPGSEHLCGEEDPFQFDLRSIVQYEKAEWRMNPS